MPQRGGGHDRRLATGWRFGSRRASPYPARIRLEKPLPKLFAYPRGGWPVGVAFVLPCEPHQTGPRPSPGYGAFGEGCAELVAVSPCNAAGRRRHHKSVGAEFSPDRSCRSTDSRAGLPVPRLRSARTDMMLPAKRPFRSTRTTDTVVPIRDEANRRYRDRPARPGRSRAGDQKVGTAIGWACTLPWRIWRPKMSRISESENRCANTSGNMPDCCILRS